MNVDSSFIKFDKISYKNINMKYYYIYIMLKFIIFYSLFFHYIQYECIKDLKKFIKHTFEGLNNKYNSKTLIYDKEIERYIYEQNDFCNNPSKYFKKEIEEQIILVNVSIMGLTYQMYIYKKG